MTNKFHKGQEVKSTSWLSDAGILTVGRCPGEEDKRYRADSGKFYVLLHSNGDFAGYHTGDSLEPITKLGKAWLAGAEIQIFREGAWLDHAETDPTLIKPYFDKLYGGHTRTARNAGSFYGGYGAAMRFPDRLDELKTLAEVYQLACVS